MPQPAAVFSSLSANCWSSSSLSPRQINVLGKPASCKAVVLQWTLTTVKFQFLLHLLLHHLQNSHSLMEAEVSKLSELSFPGIYKIVLKMMGIFVVLPLSFERNLQDFHLVSQRWSLYYTTTWWLYSSSCWCSILLRLTNGKRIIATPPSYSTYRRSCMRSNHCQMAHNYNKTNSIQLFIFTCYVNLVIR